MTKLTARKSASTRLTDTRSIVLSRAAQREGTNRTDGVDGPSRHRCARLRSLSLGKRSRPWIRLFFTLTRLPLKPGIPKRQTLGALGTLTLFTRARTSRWCRGLRLNA